MPLTHEELYDLDYLSLHMYGARDRLRVFNNEGNQIHLGNEILKLIQERGKLTVGEAADILSELGFHHVSFKRERVYTLLRSTISSLMHTMAQRKIGRLYKGEKILRRGVWCRVFYLDKRRRNLMDNIHIFQLNALAHAIIAMNDISKHAFLPKYQTISIRKRPRADVVDRVVVYLYNHNSPVGRIVLEAYHVNTKLWYSVDLFDYQDTTNDNKRIAKSAFANTDDIEFVVPIKMLTQIANTMRQVIRTKEARARRDERRQTRRVPIVTILPDFK